MLILFFLYMMYMNVFYYYIKYNKSLFILCWCEFSNYFLIIVLTPHIHNKDCFKHETHKLAPIKFLLITISYKIILYFFKNSFSRFYFLIMSSIHNKSLSMFNIENVICYERKTIIMNCTRDSIFFLLIINMQHKYM